MYGAFEIARNAFIGTSEDAHPFTVDNEFIKHGYRVNHDNCCKMMGSLFTCHNESVNVWSHFKTIKHVSTTARGNKLIITSLSLSR